MIRAQDTVEFFSSVHQCAKESRIAVDRDGRVALSTARVYEDGPDTSRQFEALCEFLRRRDIRVNIGAERPLGLERTAIGCYTPSFNAVWIKPGINPKTQLHALAHEAAHVLTFEPLEDEVKRLWRPRTVEDVRISPFLHLNVAEIVAEAAAVIATSPYLASDKRGSVHYAAMYALDTPNVEQSLRLSARIAHKTAQTLYSAINEGRGEQD